MTEFTLNYQSEIGPVKEIYTAYFQGRLGFKVVIYHDNTTRLSCWDYKLKREIFCLDGDQNSWETVPVFPQNLQQLAQELRPYI